MNRHNLVEVASCGALLAGALPSVSRVAAENRSPIPGSLGMLYDSTLRVGCQACITKCQDIDFPERNPQGEQAWSNNNKLSPYTNSIIQAWTSGTGINKGQGENGYTYIKKQCMHYVDPNCISVYPVFTLRKGPRIGIVHYGKNVCVGCRHCMIACPYNMSRYDYDNPFGALHKCGLCNQRGVERLGEGGLPGCVEVCPTGAVIFGTHGELMAETRKRLVLKPSNGYHYPCQALKSDDTYLHTVPKYCPRLYGEKEGGDTQVLVLMSMPYKNLDLPKLDDPSTGAHSEHVQHTLYKGMVLPLIVLVDLAVLIRRNTRNDHHDGGDNRES